jgi:N-hydroxyarylamine O-acetyltransferase
MDSYLARIGVERPAKPDLDALRVLQRAHLGHVPFENLSIHLGEPVRLDDDGLIDKIVRRRRGGFCYEVNGAFALLLRDLGYDVAMHSARTWGGERYGFPYDHLALVARLDGVPWLVDVGFGRFAHHPLRLDTTAEQADPAGTFRIVPHENPAGPPDLDVIGDEGPQYRLDQRPYELSDFGPGCWYHQTSPESPFTRAPLCTRLTDDGRVTLSDHTLIRTGPDGREERTVTDEEALQVYRDDFGIVLTHFPRRVDVDRPASMLTESSMLTETGQH